MPEQNPKVTLGKYELLENIGTGAQGAVFKARRLAPGTDEVAEGELVALKRLYFSGEEKQTELFNRSARLLRSLKHPNIVRYIDSFIERDPQFDEKIFCLVTELLEGQSLQKKIESTPGGLPWEQLQKWLAQALQGLECADQNRVTHRDVKPSNIFITKDGTAKLIDFDLARDQDAEATGTGGADFPGTPAYRACDWLRDTGFRGDGRSDIFSFGASFYQCLTGQLPYPAQPDENPTIAYAHRCKVGKESEVPYAHQAFKVINHAHGVIEKCLTGARADRYQNFTELLGEFNKIQRRTLILGKERYEYTEYIGKGGFGRVYRAIRKSDGCEVAIKEVKADRNSGRFLREAKALSENPHPHLVKYLDFAQNDEKGMAGDQRMFLILEYLEGMPQAGLRSRIRTSRTGMDAIEVLRIFDGYLNCLSDLHNNGKIHRDIKPANLYAPANAPERAKIFDLGIAMDMDDLSSVGGNVPGTYEYMPPEFANSKTDRGSAQSDIYSLGVTLYESLTGTLPFPKLPDSGTEAFVAWYERSQKPCEIPFTHPVFQTHPELRRLITSALAFAPKERFATANLMRQEITHILGNWQRLERKKTYEEAVAAAEQALTGEKLDEAGRCIARALVALPSGPRAIDLAKRLEDKKRLKWEYDAAIDAARKALEQCSWDQAIFQARAALKIRPDDPHATQLLDQAKTGKGPSADDRETPPTTQDTPAPSGEVPNKPAPPAKDPVAEQEPAVALDDDHTEKTRPAGPETLAALNQTEVRPIPRTKAKRRRIEYGRWLRIAAIIIVGLAIIGAGYLYWNARQAARQQYLTAITDARNTLQGGDYDKAVTLANGILLHYPGDKDASALVHQAFQGKFDKSISDAESALAATNFDQALGSFNIASEAASHLDDAQAGRSFATAMLDAIKDEQAGNKSDAFTAATNAMASGYSNLGDVPKFATALANDIAEANSSNRTVEKMWIDNALKLSPDNLRAQNLLNNWLRGVSPPTLLLGSPQPLVLRGGDDKLELSFGVSDEVLSPEKLQLSFSIDPPGIVTFPTSASGDNPKIDLTRSQKIRQPVQAKLLVSLSAGDRQTREEYPVEIDPSLSTTPALVLYGDSTVTADVTNNNPIRLACLARNPQGLSFRSSDPAILSQENIRFRPADANAGETNDSIILQPRRGFVGAVDIEIRAEGGEDFVATNNTLHLVVTGQPTPPKLACTLNEFTLEQDGTIQIPYTVDSDYFTPQEMGLSVTSDRADILTRELTNGTVRVRALQPGEAKITLEVTAPNRTETSSVIRATILPAEPPQITGLEASNFMASTGHPGTPIKFTITDASPPISFEGKFTGGSLETSDWKLETNDTAQGITAELTVTPPEDLDESDTFEVTVADAIGHSATHDVVFKFAPTSSILTNSIGMTFAWVKGLPGTEGSHWWGRKNGAWVGRYEVTQEEYTRIMGRNPSSNNKGGKFPVESMSVEQASQFCDRLTTQDTSSLPAGWRYSLPTEEQWEFYGANTPVDAAYAYFMHLNKGTQEVGLLQPNSFGLYDVLGNVAELTSTHFKYGAADTASYFTRRGGSFKNIPETLSPNPSDKTHWMFVPEQGDGADTGFRVIIVPSGSR